MRRAFLGSIALCFAGAGVTLAQPWGPPPSAPPPGFGILQPPGMMAQAPASRPNWGNWPSPEARGETPPVAPADKKGDSGSAPCPEQCGEPECCPPPPPEPPMPYVIYSWASIEHLRWQIKDAPLPVALATGSSELTALFPGAFGEPGTMLLYGAREVDFDTGHGLKVACGLYDPDVNLGLEGSVFRLEDLVSRFETNVGPNENRVLARPFFDTNAGNQPAVIYQAFPDLFYGGLSANSSARFWGAEGNIAGCVCSGDGINLDLLCGFRYYDLKEDLIVTDTTVVQNGIAFFNGQQVLEGQIVRQDNFDTRNKFYGGQFGFRTEMYVGKLFANFKGMVAVGTNHQSSWIRGSSQLFSTSGTNQGYTLGGVLALRENSYRVSQDSATVIPTFEVNVGCDITCWLRVYAGYTFLYWASVTRPGDQIDLFLDSRSIPTSPNFDPTVRAISPRNPFDRSDFWAQGLNFGIAIRF